MNEWLLALLTYYKANPYLRNLEMPSPQDRQGEAVNVDESGESVIEQAARLGNPRIVEQLTQYAENNPQQGVVS